MGWLPCCCDVVVPPTINCGCQFYQCPIGTECEGIDDNGPWRLPNGALNMGGDVTVLIWNADPRGNPGGPLYGSIIERECVEAGSNQGFLQLAEFGIGGGGTTLNLRIREATSALTEVEIGVVFPQEFATNNCNQNDAQQNFDCKMVVARLKMNGANLDKLNLRINDFTREASAPANFVPGPSDRHFMARGGDDDVFGGRLGGCFKHVAIWHSFLTDAQLDAIWNSGCGTAFSTWPTANLYDHWDFSSPLIPDGSYEPLPECRDFIGDNGGELECVCLQQTCLAANPAC